MRKYKRQSSREEENRLRALYLSRHAEDLEDLEGALLQFVSGLLSLGTAGSAELAASVYRAACQAWHRNRVGEGGYGHLNMTHPAERQTVSHHSHLLDDLTKAERNTVPAEEAYAEPWGELGREWEEFLSEQEGETR